MPSSTEKFRLVVSGLMGRVWIAKLTKTPNLMSQDRREVPKSEFIDAILQWTYPQLSKKCDTLSITIDDKVVAEITIKDRSLFEKQ